MWFILDNSLLYVDNWEKKSDMGEKIPRSRFLPSHQISWTVAPMKNPRPVFETSWEVWSFEISFIHVKLKVPRPPPYIFEFPLFQHWNSQCKGDCQGRAWNYRVRRIWWLNDLKSKTDLEVDEIMFLVRVCWITLFWIWMGFIQASGWCSNGWTFELPQCRYFYGRFWRKCKN